MNETELLQKIKDAEQQLADARRMLEEYRKSGAVRPDIDEEYYYIDSYARVIRTTWLDDENLDKIKFEIGNVFRTYDDAEREIRRRKTHQKLKELAAELNTEPIDLNNCLQYKWFVYYHAIDKNVRMTYTRATYAPGKVYFTECCLDMILEAIPEEELIEYCKGEY